MRGSKLLASAAAFLALAAPVWVIPKAAAKSVELKAVIFEDVKPLFMDKVSAVHSSSDHS